MNKILKRVIGLYCCSLTLYAATFPQKSISYSTGIGSPITTATADTMDKGQVGISYRVEYYPSIPLSNTVLLQHPLAENQKYNLTNYILAFYGLEENITIGASLPYVINSSISAVAINEETNIKSIIQLGNSSGIGDTNVFSLWRLLDEEKHPASLALLSGINTPTGKTTVRDNYGVLFSAADQPGSGAWTPFAGIIISKQFKKLSLSSNLIYTQSTEGTQQTTLGSLWDYNFGTVIELYKSEQKKLHIDGIIEINGEYAAKDNIEGLIDPNSGGNSIFLLPGLRINLGANISCYLGVNIPVIQYFYGTQVKSAYGLTGGIDFSSNT
ncbi:transporter [Legionella sp. WA2022007384]